MSSWFINWILSIWDWRLNFESKIVVSKILLLLTTFFIDLFNLPDKICCVDNFFCNENSVKTVKQRSGRCRVERISTVTAGSETRVKAKINIVVRNKCCRCDTYLSWRHVVIYWRDTSLYLGSHWPPLYPIKARPRLQHGGAHVSSHP